MCNMHIRTALHQIHRVQQARGQGVCRFKQALTDLPPELTCELTLTVRRRASVTELME